MKRFVSLGLCFTLSLVLVFGSFFSSSSFTLSNNAFADDMMGDSMGGGGSDNGGSGGDTDQVGDSGVGGDGGDKNNDDDSNDMPKDAPLTTDALTAGGDSDNDDDSGGSRDDDDNDDDNDDESDNDSEPIPKDAPATNNALTAKKLECPEGQEDVLFSTSCRSFRPLPPLPTITYKPSPGVLPYKGNEVELIGSYEHIGGAKVTSTTTTDPSFFTFPDGTIMEVTIESDSNNPSESTRHAKITPGSDTPLDSLGVVQVVLPSSKSDHTTGNVQDVLPPNSKPGTGGEFVHKIQYNDGISVIASKNGDQEFWDVYDSNNQLKSTTMVDPATKTTAIENKQDNSVTFHPQGANSYTIYPRAADGTQKTVTMTSTGEPILTVRDANNNVIRPKE